MGVCSCLLPQSRHVPNLAAHTAVECGRRVQERGDCLRGVLAFSDSEVCPQTRALSSRFSCEMLVWAAHAPKSNPSQPGARRTPGDLDRLNTSAWLRDEAMVVRGRSRHGMLEKYRFYNPFYTCFTLNSSF